MPLELGYEDYGWGTIDSTALGSTIESWDYGAGDIMPSHEDIMQNLTDMGFTDVQNLAPYLPSAPYEEIGIAKQGYYDDLKDLGTAARGKVQEFTQKERGYIGRSGFEDIGKSEEATTFKDKIGYGMESGKRESSLSYQAEELSLFRKYESDVQGRVLQALEGELINAPNYISDGDLMTGHELSDSGSAIVDNPPADLIDEESFFEDISQMDDIDVWQDNPYGS